MEAYRIYEKQNSVEAQYCDALELMILQMQNAPIKKQQAVQNCLLLTVKKVAAATFLSDARSHWSLRSRPFDRVKKLFLTK